MGSRRETQNFEKNDSERKRKDREISSSPDSESAQSPQYKQHIAHSVHPHRAAQ